MTLGLKAGHYRAGLMMADGRRVTGKRTGVRNGQRVVTLTFDTGAPWTGAADTVPDVAPRRTAGAVPMMAGPTRGGRSIPQQEIFAALAPPRRKRVGTVDGYERLLERMAY
jgi:hypothetical protein